MAKTVFLTLLYDVCVLIWVAKKKIYADKLLKYKFGCGGKSSLDLITCTLEKFGQISLYIYDWWRYCKAQCDVKFRQIEGNGRTLVHILQSNRVISLNFQTVWAKILYIRIKICWPNQSPMPSYIGLLIRGLGPDGVDWYKLARSRKSCETSPLKNTVNCFALHITQEKHISWPLYDITCFCGQQ